MPYPKSDEALRDLIAGRLTFQFIPALSAVPQIRDGAAKKSRFNEAVNAIVQSDAVRTQLTDLGSIVPPAMSPDEVDAYYTVQRDTWIPVVRDTGVRRNSG